MTTYLISTVWRGKINIGNMRIRHSLDDAVQYCYDMLTKDISSFHSQEIKNNPFLGGYYRIYEFSDQNNKPKLISDKTIEKVAKQLNLITYY